MITTTTTDLDSACFDKYAHFVHKITGITLLPNRKKMLSGRLRKRMNQLSIHCYDQYLLLTKASDSEKNALINLVTTNETYFYRTPRVWDFFTKRYLTTQKNPINIWSAASSTGEEAYTLGIMCEQYKSQNTSFDYKILGTDISSDVINICNSGLYNGRSIKRFYDENTALFNQYMKGDNESGYSVTPNIKKNITFKTHNIFSDLPSKTTFDIIFLRNVLIYFNKEDQVKLLNHIKQYLHPNGFIVIGESESIVRLGTDFKLQEPLIYHLK